MQATLKSIYTLAIETGAEQVAYNIYDFENYLHQKHSIVIAYHRDKYGVNSRIDYLPSEHRFVWF